MVEVDGRETGSEGRIRFVRLQDRCVFVRGVVESIVQL